MARPTLSSEFMQYLASHDLNGDSPDGIAQLPSLNDISKTLNVSVARLREQLEVAEALGLVEVRPRTGIRRLPYAFSPAVSQSLSYAIQLDRHHFEAFAELRNQIEASFWFQAVQKLSGPDHEYLQGLIHQAWRKLRGDPVVIPHQEHRLLHLSIFSKLENPFVTGLLEAYWDAYEAVGLNVFADYNYLQQVWRYHQQMVDAICCQDYQTGFQALVEHKDLIYHRSQSQSSFARRDPA
jgi:DNA-binding FadR family transcriptional regulator